MNNYGVFFYLDEASRMHGRPLVRHVSGRSFLSREERLRRGWPAERPLIQRKVKEDLTEVFRRTLVWEIALQGNVFLWILRPKSGFCCFWSTSEGCSKMKWFPATSVSVCVCVFQLVCHLYFWHSLQQFTSSPQESSRRLMSGNY